jgi:glutamine synthetase
MALADAESVAALAERIAADGVAGLWIVWHDYSARACAKWIPRESIPGALTSGGVFARANLNFTIDDHQVDAPRFAADSGDFFAVPDPATYALVPYRPGIGRVLSHLCTEDGALWEGCPRGRLERTLAALRERGLSARVAFEPEFALFHKTSAGYEPADSYAMYSVDRIDANLSLLAQIDAALRAQGVRVIQLGSEYGPGQLEINLHHEAPVKAADDLVTFRETVKALARDNGLVASFMPKPFAHQAGSGVHVHLSLWDAEGTASRSEGTGPAGLSSELASFMAGVLAHAPAICGVAAPTVNSYKRLLPGSWAPAHIAWATGNRAALVRVPGSSRRRIEFRAGDHTGNPYLVLAALLAAGIDGLDRQLDPGAAAEGDIGHADVADLAARGIGLLPRSAGEALAAVEADAVVMAALGPVCGPELLRVKRYELACYETQVTDWEREVYLERV